MRLILAMAVCFLSMGVMCMGADLKITQIDGQAELGTVEFHGVGSGDFDADLWKSGKLNIVPDVRSPLIEPRKAGLFRNIYAPSIVDLGDKWRVFYGAWDGVPTGNDRIYSLETADFVDFGARQTVIEHGDFIHCCNVSALRLPDGMFRLMCTVYPDKDDLNKPATFTSPDGVTWNGVKAPYPAKMSDIISIDGYDKYKAADINGMNVIMYEDGMYRLYFDNFKDFGKVYRASSKDGKSFKFDGISLEQNAFVNDVKKLSVGGKPVYLMALHMNGSALWYALSDDGLKFDPSKELAKNLGTADKFMVAVGWVTRGNRVLGFLYGAGEVGDLNRNRIFARWLQKKVVFVADDGTRYEGKGALGPDRQIVTVPQGQSPRGHFEVFAEDGVTLLAKSAPCGLDSGAVFTLGQ